MAEIMEVEDDGQDEIQQEVQKEMQKEMQEGVHKELLGRVPLDTKKVIEEARRWIRSMSAADSKANPEKVNGHSQVTEYAGLSAQYKFFDYEWTISDVDGDDPNSEPELMDQQPESNTNPFIDIDFQVEKSGEDEGLILKIVVSHDGQAVYGLCSVHFTFFDEKTTPHPVAPMYETPQTVGNKVKYVIEKVLSGSTVQKLKKAALHSDNVFKVFCTITMCPIGKKANGC